jgi:hypothetical protein
VIEDVPHVPVLLGDLQLEPRARVTCDDGPGQLLDERLLFFEAVGPEVADQQPDAGALDGGIDNVRVQVALVSVGGLR